jgi:hypothetical protein
VLTDRAALETHNNRPDVASALADESLTCAEAAGDRWVLAMAAWARAVASPSGSELRERVETAASLLEAAGNVFHIATLFEMAITRALGLGLDRDAGYLKSRAVPLIRALDDRYLWMHLQRAVGPAALFTGDVDGARAACRELLALSRDLVVLPAAAWGLTGLAAVAARRDDLDRAARLAGAAAAHRYDEPEDPVGARLHATFLVPARARRGPDAWDAAFREGEALSFEDAIGYALGNSRPGARRFAHTPAAAVPGAA